MALCHYILIVNGQMLTPFTFHDIQRRMGDASTKSPATFQPLKIFQSKAREIIQASTENYDVIKSSNLTSLPTLSDFDATKLLPLAESFSTFDPQKTPLEPFEVSKVSEYSLEVSKDLLETTKKSPNSFESTKKSPNSFESTKTSPNPFDASLNDPSSFVSSLTSLHLHLSEQRWNFESAS